MKKRLIANILNTWVSKIRKIGKPGTDHEFQNSIRKDPIFFSESIRCPSHSWKCFFETKPFATIVLGAMMMSFVAGPVVNQYSHFLKITVLGIKQVPFEGTTAPVKQVPNWVALTEAERRMTYNQLPQSKLMDLPEYNLNNLKQGQTWTPDNDRQRNAYITYPVPNLGNYRLDGRENAGSHPGMDIKMPIGTPIYSIANGIVYKVGNQTTGFGRHIVIAHPNVPDPQNRNKKITLMSSYAHLSNTNVREGEEVKKGQRIGNSGDSGMTTAPHLHFQIDRSDAPFFPYWPFTWNDVKNAGMNSYFDAVNRGLHRDKAEKYTVHPVQFVNANKHIVSQHLIASSLQDTTVQTSDNETDALFHDTAPQHETTSSNTSLEVSTDSTTNEDAELTEILKNQQREKDRRRRALANLESQRGRTSHRRRSKIEDPITFDSDWTFIPGDSEEVVIILGENVNNPDITLSSTLRTLATITPSHLSGKHFKNGKATVRVTTKSNSAFRITADVNGEKVKSKSLRAQPFRDIASTHPLRDAITAFHQRGIITGYGDRTFRPDSTLNRAETVKILLLANNIQPQNGHNIFDDISPGAWFEYYVSTAVDHGIIKGYPDGTFRPGREINRAEFLKIALESRDISGIESIQSPFQDVPPDSWFGPYFVFAKQQNLLPTDDQHAKPGEAITRGEAVAIMHALDQKRYVAQGE